MATVIFPRLKKVPDGATKEDRQKLYDEYCVELRRLNPRHFNADGTQKTLWQWLASLFT